LTHYFFVFPWLAILLYLLIRPGRLARRRLAACVILTSLLILPWYLKLPESLATWRISQGWLRLQPPGFDRWGASLGLITQPFSWQHVHQPSLIGYRLLLWRLVKHQWLIQHVHQPWIGYRVSYICALILFGFVGVAMVWRLRFHICGRGKLLLWLIFGAASAAPCAVDFVQHTYIRGCGTCLFSPSRQAPYAGSHSRRLVAQRPSYLPQSIALVPDERDRACC